MKYIKIYEGFLDKMYEKLPEVKLAMSLANFMNMVKPELECKYKRNSDGLWIVTHNEIKLVYMEIFINDVQITFFDHHQNEYTEDILDFLLYVFDTDIIDADIEKDDIPEVISKLTIEKYEFFLREKDANKYNL